MTVVTILMAGPVMKYYLNKYNAEVEAKNIESKDKSFTRPDKTFVTN